MEATTFSLDLESGAPLQQQIRERLIHSIATGVLEPGAKAPSSRGLASRLGVARNTVLLVYQQLIAEGYLIARERSGVFIADNIAEIRSLPLAQQSRSSVSQTPPGWRALIKRRSQIDWSRRIPPDWGLHPYPFLEGCFDRELAFHAEWREASRAAFTGAEFATWSANFSEADDEKLLHETRTKLLPQRGIEAGEEELLITGGWRQALDLVIQLFVDGRARVAIEEPGLPELREMLRLQRADVVTQPVDREGMLVDGRLAGCSLIIAMPARHAPTGVQMSRTRQRTLLRTAADNDGLIVEVDLSGAGASAGNSPALKSFDGAGRVIYVSALCDAFGPGLQLGLIVAPAEVIRELRKLRSLIAGPTPRAAQRMGALLISLGHHASATTKLKRLIGERLTALRDALNYYLPRLVHINAKLSGSSVWVTGPPGLRATLLAKEAAKRGVLVEAGPRFFHADAGADTFRMGVSSLPIGRIREGVATLAKVMHELTDPSLDRLDPTRPTWLSGAALRDLMPGVTLLCQTAYGDPYSVEVRADGVLVGRAGYAHEDCDEGLWWIEDDHWCRRWNEWSYGDTAKFLTVVENDQIKWYKDDLVLFNRGVLVRPEMS